MNTTAAGMSENICDLQNIFSGKRETGKKRRNRSSSLSSTHWLLFLHSHHQVAAISTPLPRFQPVDSYVPVPITCSWSLTPMTGCEPKPTGQSLMGGMGPCPPRLLSDGPQTTCWLTAAATVRTRSGGHKSSHHSMCISDPDFIHTNGGREEGGDRGKKSCLFMCV